MKTCVIIPCHNYAHWLPYALNSVLNQEYSDDIRISICNDGSSDNTKDTVEAYDFKQIEHVVSHHEHAHGPSKARNTAIAAGLAKWPDTELVAFLDADDMMYPKKLATMEPLFKITEVGVVYADNDLLGPGYEAPVREWREPYSMSRAVKENIGLNNTCVVRIEALKSVAFPDGSWYDNSLRTCEDYDLMLRISKQWMIVHIAECLTTLRVHENNSTSTVSNERWVTDRRMVLERHMKNDT